MRHKIIHSYKNHVPVDTVFSRWNLITGAIVLLITLTFITIGWYFPVDRSRLSLVFPKSNSQAATMTNGSGKWTVYEITLETGTNYSNPYSDVSLKAVFTGPNQQSITTYAFWYGTNTSGKNVYKVRFTPTVEGSWSYSITASPANTELTTNGTISVAAAPASAKGFVRRDPTYPSNFMYDNGSHYFLVGQTYYEIVRHALVNDTWKQAIDQSASYGMNKVRLLISHWAPGSDRAYSGLYPFVMNGTTVDRSRLNPTYWQKLDDVVNYLYQKGMVADIILFTDTSLAFGTQAQDEVYLKYAMNRYAAYPNVMWCLTNEWEYTEKPTTYWDWAGGVVRASDPWFTNGQALRPLSLHNKTSGSSGGKFSYFSSSWPVHAIIQWGIRNGAYTNGDQWGYKSITNNLGHSMPVVNDEYGYMYESNTTITMNRVIHRNVIWGIRMAGGYGSAGDARDSGNGSNFYIADWQYGPEYDDIKVMSNFWTTSGREYWKMTPQQSIITNGTRAYALGQSGKEFVVYAAAGGSVSITIPGSGTYSVTQINPSTGAATTLADVGAGSSKTYSLGSTDAVLDFTVKNNPTPTFTPTPTPTIRPTSTPTPTLRPIATITPTPTQGVPSADINKDGVVNVFDLGLLSSHYGQAVTSSSDEVTKNCDINKDNIINIFDLGILIGQYRL